MDSLFQVWLWGSCKLGYIKKYNIQRDESMKIARESLEEAFTPQLKSMLSIYNFLKVKLCYRTYWKQWIAFILITIILYLWAELGVGIFFQDSWGGY